MDTIIKISHITLLVHSQDEACAFYTKKLGFVVIERIRYKKIFSWLTIAPNKNSSTALTLILPETEKDKALIGRQSGSEPFLTLITDDCFKIAAELGAKGVIFVKQPVREFGAIDSVIKDLYGNLITIHQPEKNNYYE